jgi:hypothetical protein
MKRVLSAAAIALCTFSLTGPAFAQTTPEIAKGNCKAVSASCEKTVEYCNEKKGKLGSASTINAMKDAIDACKATSQFLERGSSLAPKSAEIAVSACNECAKVCDQFKDDTQLTSCANECRKAASNLQKIH